MEAFFFALSVVILIINILVANENIKNRNTITLFISAIDTYVAAYTTMVAKFNEVAIAFNATKEVTDNQAELLESILSGKIPVLNPVLDTPQRTSKARKSRKVSKDTPRKSTEAD